MRLLQFAVAVCSSLHVGAIGAGSPWDRIGPWNIFDSPGPNYNGEAGTLACAASHEKSPEVIYAGGQNNGVSSGILKSVDGGKHWTRNSKGLWDTRILGCWVHPDHEDGSYAFAGTHSGVYESADGAASWKLCDETKDWGMVRSFRSGMIKGERYIFANSDKAILTRKMDSVCGWQKIDAPGGFPANQHLSIHIQDGNTEVLTVVGGWGGGDMYYGAIVNETFAEWTGPVTTTAGEKLNPSNVAIDPNDRNHFLFSKGGEYHTYESKDGGKTATLIASHADRGAFFVMIDNQGWFYTATQDGAFVSVNAGANWSALNVWMTNRDGTMHNRVPHDYQRIVPDFRGDGIAIPSDQGLHLVDRATIYNMTQAIGDLKNAMALSAIISPSATNPGSRNVVVNMWDWNVCASWDDGTTWAGWNSTESSPGWCGEGGGGVGMGASGKVVMFHRNHWAQSSDGGHNWMRGDSPGGPGGSFDYIRLAGSRTEPAGTCFNTMDAPANTPPAPPPAPPPPPPPSPFSGAWTAFKDQTLRCSGEEFKGAKGTTTSAQDCLGLVEKDVSLNFATWKESSAGGDNVCYTCAIRTRGKDPSSWGLSSAPGATSFARPVEDDVDDDDDKPWVPYVDEDDDDDDADNEMNPNKVGPQYKPGVQPVKNGNVRFLMTSEDFGVNWNWTAMPANFQAGGLAVDPTSQHSLFGVTSTCLAHSTDKGVTWSACSTAKGLTGNFQALVVKDSKVMFMMRSGAVPLRTTDGGVTWTELTSAAPLYQYGASFDASLSWSGSTLVLHGTDLGAIGRGEYGSKVWKSCDAGDTWTDETGDLVTISTGPGVWYDKDFYFVTRGEGVTVKRNFDCSSEQLVI